MFSLPVLRLMFKRWTFYDNILDITNLSTLPTTETLHILLFGDKYLYPMKLTTKF